MGRGATSSWTSRVNLGQSPVASLASSYMSGPYLEGLKELVAFRVEAGCPLLHPSTHTLAQLTDEEGSQSGLLVVVLDVHIDHMHWLAGLLLSGIEV